MSSTNSITQQKSVSIPIRNIWLLMLYASEFFHLYKGKVDIEDNPDDIPNLVAEILAYNVERRLKRNLSYGYCSVQSELNRVRGRIDILTTERHQLLSRGKIACQFQELTINTPRNRYIRVALEKIAQIVNRKDLSHRCFLLANTLKQLGVSGKRPSHIETSTDRFGRHNSDDRYMVAAAKLVFNLALPTEKHGTHDLGFPDRDINWFWRLYENAIGGFYKVVLEPMGWNIFTGKHLEWPIKSKTSRINDILPSMKTDIVLDNNIDEKRIVIDTKFTSILKQGQFK